MVHASRCPSAGDRRACACRRRPRHVRSEWAHAGDGSRAWRASASPAAHVVASHTAGTDRAAAAGGLSRQRPVVRAGGRSILSHGMPAPPHRAGTCANCLGQSPSLGSPRCARGARHDGGRPCQLETLRALAANGANLDLVNEAGATPLVWAALGGQADVRLTRHTVPHNTHIWRTRRSQHAHRAARVHRARRRPTCVAAAAAAATFCEVLRALWRGLTVRTTATQCCSTQVIRELADAQCDPNRRDAHGRTALMAAARGGCALGPGAAAEGAGPVPVQMWAG